MHVLGIGAVDGRPEGNGEVQGELKGLQSRLLRPEPHVRRKWTGSTIDVGGRGRVVCRVGLTTRYSL